MSLVSYLFLIDMIYMNKKPKTLIKNKKSEHGHKYLKLLLESYPAPPVGHFKSEGRKCFETGGCQNNSIKHILKYAQIWG